MNDILNSIKAHLYDRTASPLFGALVLSWAAVNYKFLFVLFSSGDIDKKFNYISNTLYPDPYYYIGYLFVLPLFITIIYIFVFPYPAEFVYEYSQNRQQRLNKIKQNIEDNKLLTIEQSRDIRRQIAEISMEYEQEISKKNEEISSFKDLVTKRDEEIQKLEAFEMTNKPKPETRTQTGDKKKIKYIGEKEHEYSQDELADIIKTLSKDEIKLLAIIGTSDTPDLSDILYDLKLPNFKFTTYLERLEEKKLIIGGWNTSQNVYLSKNGRKLLMLIDEEHKSTSSQKNIEPESIRILETIKFAHNMPIKALADILLLDEKELFFKLHALEDMGAIEPTWDEDNTITITKKGIDLLSKL